MITLSIDVNKIDKSRFFSKKNGAKMLDLVLIETPNNKYGTDYMVVQSQTKEERENRVKSTILGNARIIERRAGATTKAPRTGGSEEEW